MTNPRDALQSLDWQKNEAKSREAIVFTCRELERSIITKNHDYGDAVFQKPDLLPAITPCEAIMVRMSDKIARIRNILSGASVAVTESLRDSVLDLAGYCVLWLIADDKRRRDAELKECEDTDKEMECPL